MYLRQAQHSDVARIVKWRGDAAEWLAGKGSDQWSDAGLDDATFYARVSQSVTDGETWIACTDDGKPLGTIALDQWADDGLWSAETLRHSLVIHRMILDRDAARRGVGTAMLQHAERLAADRGLTWLILDAWTTNTGLHAYYEDQGFEHVGTVATKASGALFQRRVSTAAAQVLSTTIQHPLVELDGPLQENPSKPDHWHVTDDMTVTTPRTHGSTTNALAIPNDSRPWRLWFENGAWRISPPGRGGRETTFERDLDQSTYQVAGTPHELSALSPDTEYVIHHQTAPGGCAVVLTAANNS